MEHMYELKNTDTIIPPSLIYYEEITRESIKKAVRTAEGPRRLWPHVKDHKSKDMMRMQIEYGVAKFRTATVTKAEMVVEAGAEEVILAYPLIGPDMKRFVEPAETYPGTVLRGVEDDPAQLEALFGVCMEHNAVLPMLVDANMGMDRTGMPIERLEELYRSVPSLPGPRLRGMHCHDGGRNSRDAAIRQVQTDDVDKKVSNIMEHLNGGGICCELVAAGGTSSFPCHTGATRWYLSLGAALITDTGYYMSLPDLGSIPGVTVMTRAINHPAKGMFTTDLGYKAITLDPARQRGYIVDLEDAVLITHSEKHRALRLEDESRIPAIGNYLYVIPTHICPTTALYPEILVAKKGQVADRQQAAARNRRTTY